MSAARGPDFRPESSPSRVGCGPKISPSFGPENPKKTHKEDQHALREGPHERRGHGDLPGHKGSGAHSQKRVTVTRWKTSIKIDLATFFDSRKIRLTPKSDFLPSTKSMGELTIFLFRKSCVCVSFLRLVRCRRSHRTGLCQHAFPEGETSVRSSSHTPDTRSPTSVRAGPGSRAHQSG